MIFSELPPRARRIPYTRGVLMNHLGTTSACAENTSEQFAQCKQAGNYLRVRGEYYNPNYRTAIRLELPPRARRIPQRASSCQKLRGTTSACAENTASPRTFTPKHRNYLRVRGEYWLACGGLGVVVELPPRARRILQVPFHCEYESGTTSACAENTIE